MGRETPYSETPTESHDGPNTEKHTGSSRRFFGRDRGQHGFCHRWADGDPAPEGVDISDMDKFSENLTLLKPVNFISPWLAHAFGTLVGALVAAIVAASHKMKFALGIGEFFFCQAAS